MKLVLKRTICLITAVAVLICSLTVSVFAYGDISDGTPLGITAESAVLLDIDTDTILYRNNIHVQCRPASMTKMMTLLVAYENTADRRDELVSVTAEMIDVPSGSSSANLSSGDKISIHDLFYAMMLPSGNDAARVLAYAVSGSEKAFVELMNAKAAELQMNETHYANAHGFDDDKHYTTVYDLALLSHALCDEPALVEVFSSYKYTATVYSNGDMQNPKSLTYYNTNTMLNPNGSTYFDGLKGIKTGYTNLAGNCLASYYEKDGRRMIAVVAHSDPNNRDSDTKALFNYGLKKFDTINTAEVFASKKIVVDVENADLQDESNGQLQLFLEEDEGRDITLSKDEASKIKTFQENTVSVRYPAVTAPVMEGDYVGDVEFVYNNEVIYTARALASRRVDAETASPANLVPLNIKAKLRISFGFLKSKYFLVPLLIILSLALITVTVIYSRRRIKKRARVRQRNVTRKSSQKSRYSRPGSRSRL